MKLNYWKILGALIVLLSGALVITAVAHASPSMRQVKAAVDPAFKQRRVSIAVLIVAAAADVLTTEIDLHRGCREGNPIYGPHPSLAPLLLSIVRYLCRLGGELGQVPMRLCRHR